MCTYIAASARVFIVDPEQIVVEVVDAELRLSGFQFELVTSTTDLEQPVPICQLYPLEIAHNHKSSMKENISLSRSRIVTLFRTKIFHSRIVMP